MDLFGNEIVIDMRRNSRNKRKSNNTQNTVSNDKMTVADIYTVEEMNRINNAITAIYNVGALNVTNGMEIEEAMYQSFYLIQSIVGFEFEEEDAEAILENLELYFTEVLKTKE